MLFKWPAGKEWPTVRILRGLVQQQPLYVMRQPAPCNMPHSLHGAK